MTAWLHNPNNEVGYVCIYNCEACREQINMNADSYNLAIKDLTRVYNFAPPQEAQE